MITIIQYKTRNVKGAYLYAPETINRPLPLVVWLTGGNDGAQMPLRFSLGKLLDIGKLQPDCAVLMPAATYGHNYTTMTAEELGELIFRAMQETNTSGFFSLCGWSLGADAAAILTAGQHPFSRVCLLSNYPTAWGGKLPEISVRLLVGAKEKSAARDWSPYSVERVPGYGHEIGENVWQDGSINLLAWLAGKNERA